MLRMIGFGENVGSGFPKIIAAWKETNWGEPQLLNKLDVDEVELVLPVPSVKSSTTELSIRLSKELSKGLSETAANIYKMIYADNYITRSEIANRIGISVTAIIDIIYRQISTIYHLSTTTSRACINTGILKDWW